MRRLWDGCVWHLAIGNCPYACLTGQAPFRVFRDQSLGRFIPLGRWGERPREPFSPLSGLLCALGDFILRVMPSIYDLKPRFQALLRPLITRLAAWGWTPNRVTALALVLSILVGGLILLAR